MRGYVYILTSLDRPGIVKIGKTTQSPSKRCAELNREWYLAINTWEVQYWRWVENCGAAEVRIHRLFGAYNLGAKRYREAFRIDLAVAKETVVRVCDAYPAKSDRAINPLLQRRSILDQAAYKHIKKGGPLSNLIIQNKKNLSEADFYNWLTEIREYIDT